MTTPSPKPPEQAAPSPSSQALPPEPGKLEEEAEAAWVALRKIKNEQLSCRHDYAGMANGHYYDHCGTCAKCGIDSTDDINGDEFSLFESGFIAGARSRDALLASQGERIRELEKQLAEAASVRDDLALSALAELSGAGIPTPVEGYKDAPQFLPGDIQRLAKERDTLRAALEQVKKELEVAEGNKKHVRNVLELKDQVDALNAKLTKRVQELEFGLEKIESYADAPGGGPWCVRQARALLAAGEKAGGENVR